MQRLHHLYHLFQLIVITSVLSFILFFSLAVKTIPGQQEFNMKNSVLISLGLAASFCLIKKLKKDE
jgi:hypothetical protein